jgi:hypothetical protein
LSLVFSTSTPHDDDGGGGGSCEYSGLANV